MKGRGQGRRRADVEGNGEQQEGENGRRGERIKGMPINRREGPVARTSSLATTNN